MDPLDFCNKWLKGEANRTKPSPSDKRTLAILLSLSETRVRSWYFKIGSIDRSKPKQIHLDFLTLLDICLATQALKDDEVLKDFRNRLTVSDKVS